MSPDVCVQRVHLPLHPGEVDLTPAARAILGGARLSVGPTGGVAMRPPMDLRGDAARAFIDEARRTLRPVLDDPGTRATLLRMLTPRPAGWGSACACDLVALLWAPDLEPLPPFNVAMGHRVENVRRFVRALRHEAMNGPTWTDRYGAVRIAARVHTGAFWSDVAAVDEAWRLAVGFPGEPGATPPIADA